MFAPINLRVTGSASQRELEYDFVVSSKADPSSINLEIEGADSLEVDADGDLILHAAEKEVRLRKPCIYQETAGVRRDIDGGYVVHERRVAFQLAAYDTSRPLVIDPVLSYSTYLGGSMLDEGRDIAVDRAGNAYVIGTTASTDFPTTFGAFDNTCGNDANCNLETYSAIGVISTADVFVAKFNPAGRLLYSTYLGGGMDDIGLGIAIDAEGNAYVTGYTISFDFPLIHSIKDYTGDPDAFVAKLGSDGSSLSYSTLLGGGGWDAGNSIAVDSSGSAYVVGAGVAASAYKPGIDTFICKLSPDGSSFSYSTLIGGTGFYVASGVALDPSDNAYIIGNVIAGEFPTTAGAFHADCCSKSFIAKINLDAGVLLYASYLGPAEPTDIAVDAAGYAYVTGTTDSLEFPTTAGALQTARGNNNNAFVMRIRPDGSSLVYSTYLGGDSAAEGNAIVVDSAGNASIVGSSIYPGFPLADPIYTEPGGFLAKSALDPRCCFLHLSAVLEMRSLSTRRAIFILPVHPEHLIFRS
jgi:hypothetical protein